MEIAIIGGGITGLSLALHLHQRGIACRVFERVAEVKELGVGITLLPHAMREFAALGLSQELLAQGIENQESCFFNRFGQLIYKEARGKFGGNPYPEVGIHRGRLHLILYRAALKRLGPERILTNHQCVRVEQDGEQVVVYLRESTSGRALEAQRADAVIDCEGVNSAVRKQFYPDDKLAFGGINTWRGVSRHAPILTGRSYMRIGSIMTGKLVVYPIIDNYDGAGNQLINWMAEIQGDRFTQNDWNAPGRLEDFYPIYQNWRFDWLDVAAMIRQAEFILEYPMVDKDPIEQWVFGRVALAGDAAHPMYPRGSNGAAQGVIDARTLAESLAQYESLPRALKEYENRRLPAANRVVRTNRSNPPDIINIRVEELVGDRPFEDLDRYITQDQLQALSNQYKQIAGFAMEDLGERR
ncbi:MAG TPA: flavin-dependent oxidoreductase [Candidatus Binataceae bacterium]|nr:flavin-dependent oxidoreductase [Candidatus Binataceae bacterium]